MEGIVAVLGFVGMAFILAMIILNEVWNARFERMSDEINKLSRKVDRLEQERRERSISAIRRGERVP